MVKADLENLKKVFLKYTDSFILNNNKNKPPFLLKQEHTKRVCYEITRLADKLLMSQEDIMLAEAAALLHDIGRFRQYKEYDTFLDSASVNHAKLGYKVIKDENMLEFCNEKEETLLLNAVLFHNVFALPKKIDKESIFLLKLLRDADKLDIWKVMADHYSSLDQANNQFINLGLKDNGNFSQEVLDSVLNGKVVKNNLVKVLNDFKLFQISWVFGLNFPESINRIQEKGCLENIFATLPKSKGIEKAVEYVKVYIKKNRS